MKTKPISPLMTIAEYYQRDAEDFLERFIILREQGLGRSARIKNFIDLRMGCECILKTHIALGKISEDPTSVYSKIKSASHDIRKLAALANYMQNRDCYNRISEDLSGIGVFNRYSLEAELTFFPMSRSHEEADANYSRTIGNYSWTTKLSESLSLLIKSSIDEFNGETDFDLSKIILNDLQVTEILRKKTKTKPTQ